MVEVELQLFYTLLLTLWYFYYNKMKRAVLIASIHRCIKILLGIINIKNTMFFEPKYFIAFVFSDFTIFVLGTKNNKNLISTFL